MERGREREEESKSWIIWEICVEKGGWFLDGVVPLIQGKEDFLGEGSMRGNGRAVC